MTKFIGEYTAKIDDKGRLVLPSAFKAAMSVPGDGGAAPDMRLVVKKDIYEDCLEVYTFAEWERQSEQLKSRLDFFKRDHARFWRTYMHDRAVVEPDAKFGRIGIPKRLLDLIGADREVVFSGNDHKIEIWAKEKYESSIISDEEFIALAVNLPD